MKKCFKCLDGSVLRDKVFLSYNFRYDKTRSISLNGLGHIVQTILYLKKLELPGSLLAIL